MASHGNPAVAGQPGQRTPPDHRGVSRGSGSLTLFNDIEGFAMYSASTIRRKANRQGYVIRTFRSGPYAGDHCIVDLYRNYLVAGSDGMSWEEIESWLDKEREASTTA